MTVPTERTHRAGMAERDARNELDSLFELVDRMQIPEGFTTEIVEGAIRMTPRRDDHWESIAGVYDQVRTLFERSRLRSDVRIDFPGYRNGFAPDLVLLAEDAKKNARGRWQYQDVEFVLEVISRETADNDYGKKKQAYARAGVGVCLIADPCTATCHLFTRPGDEGYGTTARFPYGEAIDLKPWGIDLALRTDEFPRHESDGRP
ncbi:Uma2 family endonuclease [Streptomyces sp. URMC 129]|uniref:Uma2 family endonuclease n=1 Tax=Streptomyces sp. URMC 129 TaxID=3423407 RepID=UPI003F1AE60C